MSRNQVELVKELASKKKIQIGNSHNHRIVNGEGWKIISGRAIKKPFRGASIKVITIKGSASSKRHEKLIMIANQEKK